jgi:hypothetical protein
MDETGMSDADKLEFVDDVLRTWGEEAAQEIAERFAIDLQALKQEPGCSSDTGDTRGPTFRRH